ncbi:unnamed protein product [Thlaspi arvense]|uniref:Alpha/beta hydrolase fold-3 domain-containing protein n=1 Tax=Thlaspi arvense TaxID=13288 RepID=A0AAU9RYE5_THLAR|nr:unnamed protein product [Thlaspi arvense]
MQSSLLCKRGGIRAPPFLKVYNDGTVERFLDSPVIPPSLSDPATEVSSRDVAISPKSLRASTCPQALVPTAGNSPSLSNFTAVVCIESTFSFLSHRYLTASSPFPTSWLSPWSTALPPSTPSPPPMQTPGPPSEAIGSEPQVGLEKNLLERTWKLVFPGALEGLDNPMINPFAVGAPKLSGIRCSRILVCVAGKDKLRDRGIRYYEAVKESGWKGNLELYEESEEGHCFYVLNPENGRAQKMKRLASFLI